MELKKLKAPDSFRHILCIDANTDFPPLHFWLCEIIQRSPNITLLFIILSQLYVNEMKRKELGVVLSD